MLTQKLRTLVVGIMLLSILAIPTLAATPSQISQEAPISQSSSQENVPYADQFVTYYRIHNGVKQYRIWNATRGYWVNDWTNIAT